MRFFYLPALITADLIENPEREISDLINEVEILNRKFEALLLNDKRKDEENQDIDRCRKICDGHDKTRWKQYSVS